MLEWIDVYIDYGEERSLVRMPSKLMKMSDPLQLQLPRWVHININHLGFAMDAPYDSRIVPPLIKNSESTWWFFPFRPQGLDIEDHTAERIFVWLRQHRGKPPRYEQDDSETYFMEGIPSSFMACVQMFASGEHSCKPSEREFSDVTTWQELLHEFGDTKRMVRLSLVQKSEIQKWDIIIELNGTIYSDLGQGRRSTLVAKSSQYTGI
jgi:hypothetical protein